MNPNSTHQTWSRWTFTVSSVNNKPLLADVKANVARFVAKAFGLATQMCITRKQNDWTFDILTEGHPVHDPTYVAYYLQNFDKFFKVGFGKDAKVRLVTKLQAGSKQDGTPAEQLIIIPTIALSTKE